MSRILLILFSLLVQLYKGLVAVKNELVMSVLYFVFLGPLAFAGLFRCSLERRFRAHGSSWTDAVDEEEFSP